MVHGRTAHRLRQDGLLGDHFRRRRRSPHRLVPRYRDSWLAGMIKRNASHDGSDGRATRCWKVESARHNFGGGYVFDGNQTSDCIHDARVVDVDAIRCVGYSQLNTDRMLREKLPIPHRTMQRIRHGAACGRCAVLEHLCVDPEAYGSYKGCSFTHVS